MIIPPTTLFRQYQHYLNFIKIKLTWISNKLSSIQQQQKIDTTGGDSAVRSFVEHQPEYPGGPDSMYRFIQKHLKYPGQAKRMGTEGKVFVQFVVNKDGSVSDVIAIKGISPECDAEAIRLVSFMPAWKPGTQQGKFVRVKYVLPINYRLTR